MSILFDSIGFYWILRSCAASIGSKSVQSPPGPFGSLTSCRHGGRHHVVEVHEERLRRSAGFPDPRHLLIWSLEASRIRRMDLHRRRLLPSRLRCLKVDAGEGTVPIQVCSHDRRGPEGKQRASDDEHPHDVPLHHGVRQLQGVQLHRHCEMKS